MLLIFFAFLAGLVTILSPCTLPVLPALLAVGAGEGKLKPLGMALGFTFSFTLFTLTASWIVASLGLPPNFLRGLAVAVLILAGLTLIFPSIGNWFAQKAEGVADAGRSLHGQSKKLPSGLLSGFIFGIALGLIWTPCAGPILASVLALSATSAVTVDLFLIVLAYSIGAALPMMLIAYTTKRLTLGPYIDKIRKGFGVLLLIAAALIWFDAATKVQAISAEYFPPIQVENNPYVLEKLSDMQGGKKEGSGGPAPEMEGITRWINSPPLTIGQLKGSVVLIDFWTYSCINCVRTLPYLKQWYEKYKDKGLVIIGVHSPEFEFEKDYDNVVAATKRFGITYPVAQDNSFKTWRAWNNQYWPAHYLIDKEGIIRYTHFGEGKYMETENEIRKLLGLAPLKEEEPKSSNRPLSPETYLGYKRANAYVNSIQSDVSAEYSSGEQPALNQVSLSGSWKVEAERITAESDASKMSMKVLAKQVYLVMAGQGEVTVEVDGKPYKKFPLQGEQLYTIADFKGGYGLHVVTLTFPKGASGYAFTFGDESQ